MASVVVQWRIVEFKHTAPVDELLPPAQLPHLYPARFGGDQIAQRVGGVVAAGAVFVGVDFEDVLGAAGVVLEDWQAFDIRLLGPVPRN